MARLPRLALAGWPHHLVQRAHPGQALALDDVDRQAWERALREGAAGARVAIHAYALLEDRFHLVATPDAERSLSEMMQALGRRYVAVFNRRHARSGGLWAGRFRATVLEPERYLVPAMLHAELAPVRAGLTRHPADWRWSSCAHHLGRRRDPLVTEPAAYWALGNTPFDREAAWGRLLDAGLSDDLHRALQDATHLGWALGSEAFVARMAALAARPMAPRPRGRPRRTGAPAGIRTEMDPTARSDPK